MVVAASHAEDGRFQSWRAARRTGGAQWKKRWVGCLPFLPFSLFLELEYRVVFVELVQQFSFQIVSFGYFDRHAKTYHNIKNKMEEPENVPRIHIYFLNG